MTASRIIGSLGQEVAPILNYNASNADHIIIPMNVMTVRTDLALFEVNSLGN